MARILVTGAAGFIGMHTVSRFLREGFEVTGIDNLNDYYDVSLKKSRLCVLQREAARKGISFDFFEADLNSGVWHRLSQQRYEVVIHLAAQAGVRYSIENPRAYLHSNILGFQSVLEFCVQQNRPLIYASSSSVYGQTQITPFSESAACSTPESYYAATKRSNELMAHAYLKTHGLTSVGLRFFTVYGPFGRPDMAPFLFTKAAFEGKAIKVFNHGNQQRDFTYIDDIVEGIHRIATKPPKSEALILNIGNGHPASLSEFIKAIEQCTGRELRKQYVEAMRGDVSLTFADTKLLREMYGYQPQISLKKGIQQFVDWYKQYYHKC